MTVADDPNPKATGNENPESPEKQEQPPPADSKPVPGAFTPFGQPGRQEVINPNTLVTPAGLFNVFDPGTAPEDLFVSKRTPGFPLKPTPQPPYQAPSQPAPAASAKAAPTPAPTSAPRSAPKEEVDETRNLHHPPSAQTTQSPPARLRENPESDTVGIAILCVLFFVVSCAATVILGPRIVAVFTTSFHLQK